VLGFARSCCRGSLSAICESQGDQGTARAGGLQQETERERERRGNHRLHDRRYGNTQTPVRARELQRAGRGGWAFGGWWRWGVGGGDGEVRERVEMGCGGDGRGGGRAWGLFGEEWRERRVSDDPVVG
jgi:hypothetical protein